jgi:hypothetical protein
MEQILSAIVRDRVPLKANLQTIRGLDVVIAHEASESQITKVRCRAALVDLDVHIANIVDTDLAIAANMGRNTTTTMSLLHSSTRENNGSRCSVNKLKCLAWEIQVAYSKLL